MSLRPKQYRILSVVGARPQFIKAAAISRALAQQAAFLEEVLVHTGQHYDPEMSEIFFADLGLPEPRYHLGIGSGRHGDQTGRMLACLEEVLLQERPDGVLIYGDTNSTLAGALAAVKLQLPVAHVEAGMRSFNRRMPEEINRIVADHLSTLHFCATETACQNLRREGIHQGIYLTGDVMFDGLRLFATVAKRRAALLAELGLSPRAYLLLTWHRAENTDHPERARAIAAAINQLSLSYPVVFPVHPRTQKTLETLNIQLAREVLTLPPQSFPDMLCLEENAAAILTDSGGVQKEAYFFGVPCITLREETEWVETVQVGANTLAGADTAAIITATRQSLEVVRERASFPPLFGNGRAAEKIAALLVEFFHSSA